MSTPSSPLSMDAKTKFQQLWAQFGTAFMEEPMRDHEKRVEELVRENERLRLDRLELAAAKLETNKQLDETKKQVDELAEENETLKEEVNTEVKSGMERVQERNSALAAAKKEILGLKQVVANRDIIQAQERAKYKQTIKLLRDELQAAVVAHDRLRKNVGVLRGDYDSAADISDDSEEDGYEYEGEDEDGDEEQEMANQAELQLQAERSLRSGAFRRATRRQAVEATPGADSEGHDENKELIYDEDEDPIQDRYLYADGEDSEEGHYLEEDEDGEIDGVDEEEQEDDEDEAEPEEEEEEEGEEDEEEEPEQPLRRSTRRRNAPEADESDLQETIEVVGTKRGRDESSDITTADGASQIPDRQTEYGGRPASASQEASDPADRPAKRTRRQTERYINALETTKHMAKIMTPPATSPPFLPSVLPRRSANRSPARRSTTLSQSQTSTSLTTTPRRRRRGAASATEDTPKSPPSKSTPVTKSPAKKSGPIGASLKGTPTRGGGPRSTRSPRSAKKSSQFPNYKFDFTLISGFKHGRNLLVDDPETRETMEPLLHRSTERIREVAVTPGFWRSYAHKRLIQRVEAGLTPHCAFTSQFGLDSDEVEIEDPWINGTDFACTNCMKENIACFTVGDRIDTEKYGAVYRPPKA